MENMEALAFLGKFLGGVGILLLGCGLIWFLAVRLTASDKPKQKRGK